MSKPFRGGLRLALVVLLALVVPAGVLVVAGPAGAAGTVTVEVTGQGSATGDGISCTQSGGPDCSQFYADDTYQDCDPQRKPPCVTISTPPSVSVTAGADGNGYRFIGWTGCDAVSERVCTLSVDAGRTLRAAFVDVLAPTVSVSPSGPRRGRVTLTSTASDNSGTVARVDFVVRGAVVARDTTAPYSASIDTAALADGPAPVRADAYDGSGNVGSAVSTVLIDNAAPTLSVTGPDGQAFQGGSTQAWSLDATDATSGLAQLRCSVVPEGSPASYGACTSSTGHTVTGLPGGSYTFAAEATDAAGNVTTVQRSFVVDTLKPTIAAVRPTSGSTTRDRTPLISAAVADRRTATVAGPVARSGIRLLVDGVSRPFGYRSGRVSWQSFTQPTGRHTVRLTVADAVGNRASKTWTFRIRR